MQHAQTTFPSSEKALGAHWPVFWSAVWVGALASLAMVTILGLLDTALGAGALERVKDLSTWKSISLKDLIAAITGAFFAYVVGGWVSGKISGFRLAEPAMLHGAISWLVSLPLLVLFLALGAGRAFGGWYGAMIGASPLMASTTLPLPPVAVQHLALAALTATLLGLLGSVIGGWLACGEPMSITHHRTRSKNPLC